MTFSYVTHEGRVVFGPDVLNQLPDELDRAGFTDVMLLTTPGRPRDRDRVASLLGSRLATQYNDARLHVPVEVVADAMSALERGQPRSLLAYGGGSAIGLGKALAHATRLPLAVVATTYSGSEMTTVWGNSDGTVKRTFRNTEVAPRLVLYDPLLTYGLSREVTVASDRSEEH